MNEIIWYDREDMIHDIIWYARPDYDMIWYDVTWCMVWYDRPVYDMMWYDIIL